MDGAADFIAFPARDAERFPNANAGVDAILSSARRAVIAGGDDLVVLDDDCPKVAAQAGPALRDRFAISR